MPAKNIKMTCGFAHVIFNYQGFSKSSLSIGALPKIDEKT